MDTEYLQKSTPSQKTEPVCPVFGTCGGCVYQDIPYEQELALKENQLKRFLQGPLKLAESVFEPIAASPSEYYYRNRLDLTLKRGKGGECRLGFQREKTHQLVSIDACPIAERRISDAIPGLRKLLQEKMPPDYRTANIVVRTGEDGNVRWGGIGRRSLELPEKEYFWTEIRGRRIYYSLDTFFQANLSILPLMMDQIARLAAADPETVFFDFYAGVGLFGIFFADRAGRVVFVEENVPSLKLIQFNAFYHDLRNTKVVVDKVERCLPHWIRKAEEKRKIAMVDPPRRGLSPEALESLVREKSLDALFYLSCSPESLKRDLLRFIEEGWTIESVSPFDFFPKTIHLETLVFLRP